jgi:hypothetical protein
MPDLILFDQLSDLKRLSNEEAFLVLEKRFQRERGRYLAKLLDPSTSPEETLGLKAVVNALENLSPLSLAETVLKIETKNQKVKHPEMFKVKRNATA